MSPKLTPLGTLELCPPSKSTSRKARRAPAIDKTLCEGPSCPERQRERRPGSSKLASSPQEPRARIRPRYSLYPFPQRWSPDDLARFESVAGSPLGAARRVSLSVTVRGPASPSASPLMVFRFVPSRPWNGATREGPQRPNGARSIDQLPQQSSSRLFLWGAPFFRGEVLRISICL